MNIRTKLNDYLIDTKYKIIIKDNQINIINYEEIIDFGINKITVKCNTNKIIIEGNNLIITKMLDDEILIKGIITIIRIM